MEQFTAKFVTQAPPSLKRAAVEASHRLMMTPSQFVRQAIAEKLERLDPPSAAAKPVTAHSQVAAA